MNKIIMGIILAVSAIFTGCKSIPSTENMYSASYSVGVASGLIANMTKVKDDAKVCNAIVEIMTAVSQVVPETNQTFKVAWTPIAQAHTQKLIEEGKITATQGILILEAFNVAIDGIDYLMNIKYPEARQYQDLVASATHGFCSGFLTVFKPVNGFSAANTEYDKDAYEYLKAKNVK